MWRFTPHTQDHISGLGNFTKEDVVTKIFVPARLTVVW